MRALFVLFYVLSLSTFANAYTYEKKIINTQVLHIVRIDYNEYHALLVKAKKRGQIGRETVSSIAKRSDATIAINAGFFEIKGKDDGKPSGTLVIAGKVYGIKNKEQDLVVIKDGLISIESSNPLNYKGEGVSIVSGIPLLLKDGQISNNIRNKRSGFYTKKHARTALGVNSKGDVVIVVAEHSYMRDISRMTLAELQKLLSEKEQSIAKRYKKKDAGDITLNELKHMLLNDKEFAKGGAGLAILELAKLMQDLGCIDAINLDGGGSSTLWIKGKVINNTIGDVDESNGLNIERPVSDAIIFKIN
jgi:exopolysaccharide biosynthesis protein